MFISDLKIYFRINRNHPDVKNYHTRVFVALSFIKGPNIVNWVDAQFWRAEDNLIGLAGGDKTDADLWNNFVNKFKRAYISTTAKESVTGRDTDSLPGSYSRPLATMGSGEG